MLDGLLKDQIRGDAEMAGMLTAYDGKPALFYQKAPTDSDRKWLKPCYPRADCNIDMRYDAERKTSGQMVINVYCTTESAAMPEEIEARLVKLISGTFYTPAGEDTVCAVWQRSDAFDIDGGNKTTQKGQPEVFGVTVSFDLLTFPIQITTTPDPVQGLNLWTRERYLEMRIIAFDTLPPVWKPSDEQPAIYWRFIGAATNDVQSYAVNWYSGQFAAHIIADTVPERNRWIKALTEAIQVDGEVILADGSPMFIKQIAVRHSADALSEGQLAITGQYGVLTQPRKEYAQNPLNRVVIPNLDNMEINNYGRNN
jgi:hypothetical protein